MTTELAPDWILKQALEAQRKANVAWVNGKPELDDGGLTLTVLGGGTIGTTILKGILQHKEHSSGSDASAEQASTTIPYETPTRLPTRFNVCVRRPESVKRVKGELEKYNARLKVFENDNLTPVKNGNIVLLCCKPQAVGDILRAEGIREALAGKLLISICAGWSETNIHDILYLGQAAPSEECTIVRAMPNTAAAVGESMTVISIPSPPLTADNRNIITWIFTRIGRVLHLPASSMDACTALCGSGPAFVALMVESLAAGAVAMGLPQEDAYTIAAQMMRGTTGLLLQGEQPAILRARVSTPGGCTIRGLGVLEDGMLRETIARAVREATTAASQLGPSKQDVSKDGV